MRRVTVLAFSVAVVSTAFAADQTVPGSGNARALETARASPRVQGALNFLVARANTIRDAPLRQETLDILTHDQVCLRHRDGLTEAQKDEVVAELVRQKLVNPADAAAIPVPAGSPSTAQLKAGVFPPAAQVEGTGCAVVPVPYRAAPGSAYIAHHPFPGGLAVHATFNTRAAEALARIYRENYGLGRESLGIDPDIVVAAPIWHDWAKTFVFQWNADGTEFIELSFGGFGARADGTDDPIEGEKGADSRTAAHHILGVAETMARGLSPAMVVAQAAAHSKPTIDEYKVVNWLRAAAIVARVDPVARGYLKLDLKGNLRLPPLRKLGDGLDLNGPPLGETNLLVEYAINCLSDSDFNFSVPAAIDAVFILEKLGPEFGYTPPAKSEDPTRYNTQYRNVALAQLSGERIFFLFVEKGLPGVRRELAELRRRKLI
jgi:hypothetical protein